MTASFHILSISSFTNHPTIWHYILITYAVGKALLNKPKTGVRGFSIVLHQ